jgi:hypothetical protein
MFADPAVVTVNAVAKNLVRINQDKYSSEYLLRTTVDEYRLNIRNTNYLDKKRNVTIDRHNVELIHTVFPVAPATLSTVRKVYSVIENQRGDTLVDPRNVALALYAFMSSAKIDQLMNFES